MALLEDLRHGSRAGVAVAMRQHNHSVWRIARGILGDDTDTEDAVQDAYVRAFTSLDAFRGDASLGTWLARIVIKLIGHGDTTAGPRCQCAIHARLPRLSRYPNQDRLPMCHPVAIASAFHASG